MIRVVSVSSADKLIFEGGKVERVGGLTGEQRADASSGTAQRAKGDRVAPRPGGEVAVEAQGADPAAEVSIRAQDAHEQGVIAAAGGQLEQGGAEPAAVRVRAGAGVRG